jgi:NitT/TauT family transport system ATP-binding protein
MMTPPEFRTGNPPQVDNIVRLHGVETTENQPAAIRLADITQIFQSRQDQVLALEKISIAVRPREFLCIIGPSGCGKSTILALTAGLLKPTAGEISISGRSMDSARRGHEIGMIFQDAVLLPWRTVWENVELPLEVLNIAKIERTDKIRSVLELVQLQGFEHRFPHELSGGMRQRLGIARALSFDPQILLMDEPFGALDAITRDQMAIELLRIWEQRQKTVIFVTHSIGEAAFLSDRVVVMTPRPGCIRAIIENPLPRPRTLAMRDSPDFLSTARRLRELLEAA